METNQRRSHDEQGFALPSVLFLLTILALISSSIISLQYFRRQQVASDIAHVKAEYAAQSGIARMISDMDKGYRFDSSAKENSYKYPDQSKADVTAIPWGAFLLLKSDGYYNRTKSIRRALVGTLPTGTLEKALVFNNANHQLVLAGDSFIKGDILVGQAGVTVGVLPGSWTPKNVPVEGVTQRVSATSVTPFDPSAMLSQISYGEELLSQAKKGIANAFIFPEIHSANQVQFRKIPDSVATVVVKGDLQFSDTLTRGESPLTVLVLGNLSIDSHAEVSGLIRFIVEGSIAIHGDVSVDHIIFVTADSIQIGPQVSLSGQFFAPKVRMQSASTVRYPSVVVSYSPQNSTKNQQITLENGCRFEGTLMLLEASNSSKQNDLVRVDAGVLLVGHLYSEAKTTLDGRVVGSVNTRDFYFYQAPTIYNGWIRTGKIDRTALPGGFLAPVGFLSSPHFDVL